jgi:glycine amidinotransferase/scyllo-inosamine-4-phosphate amidinotransferase 1
MGMINTVNEWDPLKSIMVGSATAANWPRHDPVFAQEANKTAWHETPVPQGPVPQAIVDQANRELDQLCETLLRLGVTVYRPTPMNFVELDGMYNYCPRDRLLVWKDTIVDVNMMYPCRNQELQAYQRILDQAKTVLSMPRDQGMILDAANVCRLGNTWLFLESYSGNRAAYEWLCEKFPQVTIELCNFYAGVHIDSTIVPLREGLVLLNASRVTEQTCPVAFRDWQKIWVTEDMIVPQDFYQYPYASKWIAMNMLAVDPETVVVDAAQKHLHDVLKQNGITAIPMTLSHSRTLGGGFHCVTLDLIRHSNEH